MDNSGRCYDCEDLRGGALCNRCVASDQAATSDYRFDIMPDHVVMGMVADEVCNLRERLKVVKLGNRNQSIDLEAAASMLEGVAARLYQLSCEVGEVEHPKQSLAYQTE